MLYSSAALAHTAAERHHPPSIHCVFLDKRHAASRSNSPHTFNCDERRGAGPPFGITVNFCKAERTPPFSERPKLQGRANTAVSERSEAARRREHSQAVWASA